jgi:IS5 family transposase
MEAVEAWKALFDLLLQWCSLSAQAMAKALTERPTMLRFAGIALSSARIPDESAVVTFHQLLEKRELGEQMHAVVASATQALELTPAADLPHGEKKWVTATPQTGALKTRDG